MPGKRGEGYFTISFSSCQRAEIDTGDNILSVYCVSGTVPSSVDKTMSPELWGGSIIHKAVPVIPTLRRWRQKSRGSSSFYLPSELESSSGS